MEDLHGDFVFAIVEGLELEVVDGDVLFNVIAWEDDLFVFPGAIRADKHPVGDGGGYAGQDEEKEIGLEAAAVEEGQI